MKASELMVGDWVINPVHHDKTKVEGIYYDKELHCLVATDGRFPQEMFEPIPITEEILTANGLDPTMYCNLSMPRWFMGIRKGNKYIGMSFEYVHELQHAMRLCGLNDMADNFKIE